jgi:Ca2+/Na+ antiporter
MRARTRVCVCGAFIISIFSPLLFSCILFIILSHAHANDEHFFSFFLIYLFFFFSCLSRINILACDKLMSNVSCVTYLIDWHTQTSSNVNKNQRKNQWLCSYLTLILTHFLTWFSRMKFERLRWSVKVNKHL